MSPRARQDRTGAVCCCVSLAWGDLAAVFEPARVSDEQVSWVPALVTHRSARCTWVAGQPLQWSWRGPLRDSSLRALQASQCRARAFGQGARTPSPCPPLNPGAFRLTALAFARDGRISVAGMLCTGHSRLHQHSRQGGTDQPGPRAHVSPAGRGCEHVRQKESSSSDGCGCGLVVFGAVGLFQAVMGYFLHRYGLRLSQVLAHSLGWAQGQPALHSPRLSPALDI